MSIYKITCLLTQKIYIGSSIQPLAVRIREHKAKYTEYLNKNGDYCSSFVILKNNNWNWRLLENYKCNDIIELRKRENEWIKKLCKEGLDIVNKNQAYLSKEDKKAYHRKYSLMWEHKNKDKRNTRKRELYANQNEGQIQKLKERKQNWYNKNNYRLSCLLCRKEMVNTSFTQHLKTHDGALSCRFCRKEFTANSNWKKHIKSHTIN